jgi:hypothetical protein
MASNLQEAPRRQVSPQLKLRLMEDTAGGIAGPPMKRLKAGAVLGERPVAGKRLTEEVFLRLFGRGDRVSSRARRSARRGRSGGRPPPKKLVLDLRSLNVVLDEERRR